MKRARHTTATPHRSAQALPARVGLTSTLLISVGLGSLTLGTLLAPFGAPCAFAQIEPAPAGANAPGTGSTEGVLNEEEYSKDSTTEINVKNADIAAILRIFSRKTKRNYILDEKVKGKVSIYLPGKVSADEALRILDSVLALKGFTSVPIGENLWKIVPSREARQSTIPTLKEARPGKPSAAVVTRLVNLKFVAAEDVQQLISQLTSPDGLVNAYTGTNSLILIDSEDNITRLVNLITEIDVPFSNREMTIIPIKFADVEDISQKLSEILGTPNKSGGAAGGAQGRAGANVNVPASAAQQRTGGVTSGTVAARGMEPKIISDQRTNSLIVVADGETTARVRALIAQLDSKVDLSGNKFYVYRCQHANAEEIAQVLAGLVGTGGGAGGTGAPGRFGATQPVGGGLGTDQFGGGSRNNQFNSRNRGMNGSSSGLGGSRGGGTGFGGGGSRGGQGRGQRGGAFTAQLGDNLSITADPATNSLIIAAGKSDYEKIRQLLAQIDIKRRQVLVEATLLEVSIDNTLRTNTSFLTSTGGADGGGFARSDFGGNLGTLFTDPSKLQGFTLAAASAGSLTLPGGIKIPTQSILISAAQANNNVNILSAPTILATDNEEAQIIVGQNVPFLASTSTNATNLNNTFNQVERQDVGITLRITPQISSRDYVTLRVFTEVSALDLATVNSTLGPTTRKRQSETTIIAKDTQMIVTGGLIADDVTESDEGVPYLKDIPVLGHVFKANSTARQQKNLLIFLTPRIIKDQFDARDVTLEGRDHMQDVIATYNVQPERQAVLEHDRIDSVAETVPYEGKAPGTILPPANSGSERAMVREDAYPPGFNGDLQYEDHPAKGHSDAAVVVDGSGEGVLDLQPTARLPEAPAEPVARRIEVEPTREAADTFIVVELSGSGTADLPFMLGNAGSVAGLIVPRESPAQAQSFFRRGKSYTYARGDQRVRLRVRGTFDSIPAAARGNLDAPAGWYTLSPYEIMNLGAGPWVAGE
jgi:general secretion pathway protein D